MSISDGCGLDSRKEFKFWFGSASCPVVNIGWMWSRFKEGVQVLVLVHKLIAVKNVFKEQVGCDESIIQREQDEGRPGEYINHMI